jgi:S-adenosylmethionine decarboxylase
MGNHFLLNIFGADVDLLDDEDFIRIVLDDASKHANMTLINIMSHKFYPQGVTAIALLAESHMSIHTWPEDGKAAVDVYTCGDSANPELACSIIRSKMGALSHTLEHITR